MGRVAILWLSIVVGSAACASSTEPSHLGGESHFLTRCKGTCSDGLDCIQGVCTKGCVVAVDGCTELANDAICTADSIEPGEVAVCDVGCVDDADCSAISSRHTCDAGYCRAPRAAASDGGNSGGSAPVVAGEKGQAFVCPSEGGPASDPLEVQRYVLEGDTLRFEVSFAGGCAEHTYQLCFGPTFLESAPVQTSLHLIHDDHGDSCEALPTERVSFDLGPLATYYEENYQSSAGLVSTNYGMYAFGELSCEQRDTAASAQVEDILDQAPRDCTDDGDCTWMLTNTGCTVGCGSVISAYAMYDVQASLQEVTTHVCGAYEEDGCGTVAPLPCPSPPSPRCVEGTCTRP